MKKDLTDREKEERMNYLATHKCKNENERKELKELYDWYLKDVPELIMSFSLTEEEFQMIKVPKNQIQNSSDLKSEEGK